jgi:hypothetical protein
MCYYAPSSLSRYHEVLLPLIATHEDLPSPRPILLHHAVIIALGFASSILHNVTVMVSFGVDPTGMEAVFVGTFYVVVANYFTAVIVLPDLLAQCFSFWHNTLNLISNLTLIFTLLGVINLISILIRAQIPRLRG